MFPHCSISLSGLQPFATYVVTMDMVPVDSFKYRVNAYATHTEYCMHCFAHSGIKTNRLQYVKHSSLQPDTGLPTLGRSLLHIKALHCSLFVHSRLEAQSISIPTYSRSLNEEQSAINTFNGFEINCCGPFGHRLLLPHSKKGLGTGFVQSLERPGNVSF